MENLLKRLERPTKKIDAVIDTDAYNEIDDQFAICYMLKSVDKINTVAIYAAPFSNERADTPKEGVEKSYDEILKLLDLMDMQNMKENVYMGSQTYLPDEKTPVISDAAKHLVSLAQNYSADNPLYVVAIGAITNIASAILINPEIINNIVVIWLGGHSLTWGNSNEFNMMQDVAGARILFGCKVPLVMYPCNGVVSEFRLSEPELTYWLKGKNKVCDYLVENTITEANTYAKGKPWSRVIWDVTAVSWLTGDKFSEERIVHSPIPEYDHRYAFSEDRHFIKYVYSINRDALVEDLFDKLIAE